MSFEIIDYLNNPPSKKELEELIKLLEITPFELIRKNEQVFIEKYGVQMLTPEQCIEAMLTDPVLIERPIVVDGNRAIICRPPERILDFIKG